MIDVYMFKIPFKTKHFNKNQKVWVQQTTGSLSAKVAGRFRGRGKYVSAWVSWNAIYKDKYPRPEFKKINIDIEFAKRHNLLIL